MNPADFNANADKIERKAAQAHALLRLIGGFHADANDLDDGYCASTSLAAEVVGDLIEEILQLAGAGHE